MIQVGQVLDKYELLERVGQGGMSVVYRATDRSLRRTVAVKILHRHLGDSAEARDRFEREAHAVAKLRHENIVEIFAYSGKGSEDSYIVTEFIEGCTLKEFIGDHPIAFPEVGAMIMLQVCRALGHAHSSGVLHRDVKPENVMVRTDGVVKLMDFGISQMVDLQRLTVTGQLLGSPAYMSPEHVEGQPLDFRTDIFACGIVLYQLTCNRLPFEGKNPHEILKRIAECKFADPRQANPRVGNELGKIILKAMAREPADRYQDVSEMVAALDAYMEGSGLGPVAQELARYFQAPAAYELALRPRLVDHLVRKGKGLVVVNRPQALEAFDRVLTMDPTNKTVLEVIERLSSRRRTKRGLVLGAVLVVVAGGAYGARMIILRDEAQPRQAADVDVPEPVVKPVKVTVPYEPVVVGRAVPDAAPAPARPAQGGGGAEPDRPRPPRQQVDAAPAQVVVKVKVSPKRSELKIGDGPFLRSNEDVFDVPVSGAKVHVTVRNEDCCEQKEDDLTADMTERTIALKFLPGKVLPICDVPNVIVRIDDRDARVGEKRSIPFGETTDTEKDVTVEFLTKEGKRSTKREKVQPNKTVEVRCVF